MNLKPQSETIVQFKNVNIYQDKVQILSDVNFRISSSDIIYLIGKTGSGKSSLLKTIYAELPLLYGEATVCDMSLKNIKWRHIPNLRRQIGIIYEDFQLLTDRNVYHNLDFVLRATGWKEKFNREERIIDVLTKVYLRDKIDSYPHELSGGERQRVDIARAILNYPKLIIADEPTGKLDPQTSYEIIKLLHQISIRQKTPILISSHDYDVLSKFPKARVFKTENSKLWESKS